jgi:excisionase family DNA binding protein
MDKVTKTKERAMSTKALPKLLTIEETAAALRVHSNTVYHLVRRSELRARKVGRSWRIAKQDLLAYLRADETANQ